MPDISNGEWLLVTNSIVRQLNKRIHVAKYQCDEGYLKADFEDRKCSPDGIRDTSFQGLEDVEKMWKSNSGVIYHLPSIRWKITVIH